MSKIKIGMAGWSDRSSLYPIGVRAQSSEAKLQAYSTAFQMVEHDGSYYAIPSRATTARWTRCTPEGFVFNVKAFRLFTWHSTEPRSLPREMRRKLPSRRASHDRLHYGEVPEPLRAALWEEFEEALEPLHAAGKLGVVVFQFPAYFRPTRATLRHLQECRERLPRYRVGVELRNEKWFRLATLEKLMGFLSRNDLLYIGVDGPQGLESSVPPVVDTTGGTVVVRFHGRNAEGWEMKGPEAKAERCNYWYSAKELDGWVRQVRNLAHQVEEVHLVMNTNQGLENAMLMADLLGEGIRQAPTLFHYSMAS